MQKKHTAEVPPEHGATLDTLRRAYERGAPGFRPADGGARATITATIYHLAKLAGIERGKQTRAELYDAAVRALVNDGKPTPGGIEYVQVLCAEIRREWEKNPLPPERVNRLKRDWYKIADTLRSALSTSLPSKVTTDDERAEIEREIRALADFAGIKPFSNDEWAHSYNCERTYTEALKHLGGTDKGSPHGVRLRELAAEINRREREHELREEERRKTAALPREIYLRRGADGSMALVGKGPRLPLPSSRPASVEVVHEVVDINLWRQAHPRRIQNLLFAERGGAQ